MKKMAVIDLDDTLLSPKKDISQDNLHALNVLREKEFEIVIASGRHHENIMGFQDRIGRQEWVISSNGAVVRHAQSSAMLHELTLTHSQAINVCRYAFERGLTVVGYHKDGAFAERDSEWTRRYSLGAGWETRRGRFDILAATGFQKLLLIHSPEKMDRIQPEAEKRFGSEMYVVRTENEILEIAASATNKAMGAQAVAKAMGVDRKNVLAFGDGNNDVELLTWAGRSVAMAHGRESARKAAKSVSPPGANESAFARGVLAVLQGWEGLVA